MDNGRPLPAPTSFPPGSPGKVDVMAARVERGEAIWHPLDARHDEEPAAEGADAA